jgi:hypothetical protein
MNSFVHINNDTGQCIIQEVDGFIFIHLTLLQWNKKALSTVREELDKILQEYEKKGHDVIFTIGASEKTVRFWQLVKPCFEVQKLEDGSWIGSWLTFED